MAITALGAWESVKRHFFEMNIDTQRQDFTVVGIGDMSGDVFGNGMLLSEHIRLVAAFDHRNIFVDPDPNAAVSFLESRNPAIGLSGLSMTAAANTGPASGPRPASSTPQIISPSASNKEAASSVCDMKALKHD
jgi:hypothetical protein